MCPAALSTYHILCEYLKPVLHTNVFNGWLLSNQFN
jgi:hypothetical protein